MNILSSQIIIMISMTAIRREKSYSCGNSLAMKIPDKDIPHQESDMIGSLCLEIVCCMFPVSV